MNERDQIDRLYQAEYLPMLRLARLLTGSTEIAEELVQDAFVAIFRRLGKIDNPGAYLRRTVVNNCHSELRRRATERRKIHVVADAQTADLPRELDETWRALDRLKPKQRTALVLRYYEDLTVRQVADLMGEREGTIKSLVHRGLKILRSEVTP